ncbi:MAG: hypothetical protein U1F37_02615 [Alphaproteobacteria bacterium]
MAMFRHGSRRSARPSISWNLTRKRRCRPQRQLAFQQLMAEWRDSGTVQAVFATHSPILMSLPGADVLWLDENGLRPIRPEETPHWRIYKAFLANPRRFDEPD